METEQRSAWAAARNLRQSSVVGWLGLIGKPWRFQLERRDINEGHWWDHGEGWYVPGRRGLVCCTSHPYAHVETHVEVLGRIRDEFGIHFRISDRSWYMPGSTVLIEVWKSPEVYEELAAGADNREDAAVRS